MVTNNDFETVRELVNNEQIPCSKETAWMILAKLGYYYSFYNDLPHYCDTEGVQLKAWGSITKVTKA